MEQEATDPDKQIADKGNDENRIMAIVSTASNTPIG